MRSQLQAHNLELGRRNRLSTKKIVYRERGKNCGLHARLIKIKMAASLDFLTEILKSGAHMPVQTNELFEKIRKLDDSVTGMLIFSNDLYLKMHTIVYMCAVASFNFFK